eukprot:scaffold442_cov110-Cylindrotheca_fusiformis.AAC.10
MKCGDSIQMISVSLFGNNDTCFEERNFGEVVTIITLCFAETCIQASSEVDEAGNLVFWIVSKLVEA